MVAWTETQRTAACILHDHFRQLSQQERTNIFNHLFKVERKETVSVKKLKDAFDRRKEAGSAKAWHAVCDLDDPSDEEMQRRLQLRQEVIAQVESAIDALRTGVQGGSHADQVEADAGGIFGDAEMEPAELNDVGSTNNGGNGINGTDANLTSGAPATDDQPAQSVTRAAPEVLQMPNDTLEHDASTLEMVHYRDCKSDDQLRCFTGTYVDRESEVYKLGGKAYRCLMTDMINEDVMICNRKYCAYCITGNAADTYAGLGNGPIPDEAKWMQGKPFVHASDCTKPWPYMEFKDSGKAYESDQALAEHMFSPFVLFKARDGSLRKVHAVMCQASFCRECSAEEKVQATLRGESNCRD
ncbi:hypothetical protein LTR36_004808 [Oleoguttula mirabilis]|uniref:Uncharacterized protein n=1 Tax=Oleoguttula mirabilis TaxID=1507867 RepID=A0AAV9JF06_9PEZI|nr:hypothetical protein LTR36_004808 [Oleoguttula mirabilis]